MAKSKLSFRPMDPVKCRQMYYMAKDVVTGYDAVMEMAKCISIPIRSLRRFVREIEADDKKRRKKMLSSLIALVFLFAGCQSPQPTTLVSVTRSTNTVVWLHPSNEAKTNVTVITEQHSVFYRHDGHMFVASTNFPVVTNSIEMRWHAVPRWTRRPMGLTNQPPLPPK